MSKVGFIDGKMRQVDGLWDDIRVPANIVSLPGPPEPDWQLLVPGKIYALAFDAAIEEEVYFNIQLPHGYKMDTALHPHVHYTITLPATAGDVIWGLEYTIASINDPIFPSTLLTATGTASAGIGYEHRVAGFPPILPGVPYPIWTTSAMMLCRLFRDATNIADTYPADAFFLEFDLHYQKDDLGSAREYYKES